MTNTKYESLSLRQSISNGNISRKAIKKEPGFIGKIIVTVKQILNSCKETDISGVSAQMAFIILFALLPTLLFILLICSLVISDFDTFFFNIISYLVPREGFAYITSEIDNIFTYINRLRFLIIGSSAVMGTLSAHTIITGLNQTYGFKPYSSRKWEWIKSFVMLLILCLILTVMTAILIWGGYLFQEASRTGLPVSDQNSFMIGLMSGAVIAGIFLILLGVYVFTPQRRIRVRDALPGTVFATIAILVIFQIYIQILNHSANYLIVYGSLSGLFVMLTALYFLSLMINIGAKINVFLAHENE